MLSIILDVILLNLLHISFWLGVGTRSCLNQSTSELVKASFEGPFCTSFYSVGLFLCVDYKKTLDTWAADSTEAVENTIHEVCDIANKTLDKKLQELYSVIEDIGL